MTTNNYQMGLGLENLITARNIQCSFQPSKCDMLILYRSQKDDVFCGCVNLGSDWGFGWKNIAKVIATYQVSIDYFNI